jgi:hypothetical protein
LKILDLSAEQFHNSPYGVAFRRDKFLEKAGAMFSVNSSNGVSRQIVKDLPLVILFAWPSAVGCRVRDHILRPSLDDSLIDRTIEGIGTGSAVGIADCAGLSKYLLKMNVHSLATHTVKFHQIHCKIGHVAHFRHFNGAGMGIFAVIALVRKEQLTGSTAVAYTPNSCPAKRLVKFSYDRGRYASHVQSKTDHRSRTAGNRDSDDRLRQEYDCQPSAKRTARGGRGRSEAPAHCLDYGIVRPDIAPPDC